MVERTDKVPPSGSGEEQMRSTLASSAVPVFFAGFLATSFVFGGLAASGSAMGIAAARVFAQPFVELVASIVGGAVTALALSSAKPVVKK